MKILVFTPLFVSLYRSFTIFALINSLGASTPISSSLIHNRNPPGNVTPPPSVFVMYPRSRISANSKLCPRRPIILEDYIETRVELILLKLISAPAAWGDPFTAPENFTRTSRHHIYKHPPSD